MLKGILGIILIMVMLIAITVDDTVWLKNILLRIIGVLSILQGVHLVHRQFHPHAYKRKPRNSK
ncbi:hypothetical protein CRI88_10935 [Lysinibacillus fusiformis]|uniref:Uncharacterized protein n=1 Tax=Lysinibacillus fusiformis TaxID=28031 RepID=A0A2I0UYU3_9BACI|nr:hypothetical protein CRI88_10935 [Lysinibacillus fusiformis]